VLLRGDAVVACWSLGHPEPPDLSVVDYLARLQLVARRCGCSIRLRQPSAPLSELLALAGLGRVVLPDGLAVGGRVEVGREPEGGEQLGVEEAVEPADPVA
jgi:hypothetical protein